MGLTDQHRGETGPPVELATVGQPNPGAAGLVSRVGSGAAVSAFTGRASSIGGLSVPPSWATPLAVRQIAAAFPGAAPIIMQNSQTTADSPYTGMALAGVVGTSMAGLASRGAPAATGAATTPATNKAPAATVVAANKPARSSGAALRTPAAPKAAFPSTVPVAISAAGIPADVAANLAATLAGIPGATIIVIPPPPPPG